MLNSEIQVFQYNGSPITFNSGDSVMVNATEMAKPFGKRTNDFLSTKSTQELIVSLSAKTGISATDLVVVNQGGNNQGTWLHEDLALIFAQWLSPTFYLWCNDRIKELMQTGAVALTPAELLLRQSQLLVDNERKMRELESKQQALESELAEVKQRTTASLDQSTIVAYVSRNNIKLDVTRYGAMGRKASALCKKRGVEVTKINDVRWGLVSVYPDKILDEVFAK